MLTPVQLTATRLRAWPAPCLTETNTLAPLTSAIHAYDISATLTYVKDGTILPHYQQ
jgi:hypothetical protein